MYTVPVTGSTARVGKLLSRKLLLGNVAGNGVTVAAATGTEKLDQPSVESVIMIWFVVVSPQATYRIPFGPT